MRPSRPIDQPRRSFTPRPLPPFVERFEKLWIETDDGNEIRIEALMKFELISNSKVRLECNVKLFEGAAGRAWITTDLDGEKSDSVHIPKDTTRTLKIHVRNEEEDEDEDNVDLTINISNNMAM